MPCWSRNQTTKAKDSIDDSQIQGQGLLARVATLEKMSGTEMNEHTTIKDIVQTPLERGYSWQVSDLHCGYEMREEELEGWTGSTCDFSVPFCHARRTVARLSRFER